MIDESVLISESVIFIANILVIGISVILHIGAPLLLKAYANHLLGVQVIETISLQSNGLSQIHSSVCFRLKIARQVENTWEKC